MIQNLIFVILFWKYYFDTFHTWTSSAFFIPEFVAENLKANKNQRKRSLILQYSFTQKTSLILRISTLLKLKIICSQNTAKKLSQFTNFPANMFLFGVRKNICTAPFPDAQELLSWSTLKPNVCIFLYISLRKCLFQRRSKILSDGGWERLNNFLKTVRYLGLVKYFTIFHFNFTILIQLFFSISILSSIVLKR